MKTEWKKGDKVIVDTPIGCFADIWEIVPYEDEETGMQRLGYRVSINGALFFRPDHKVWPRGESIAGFLLYVSSDTLKKYFDFFKK